MVAVKKKKYTLCAHAEIDYFLEAGLSAIKKTFWQV